MVTGGKGCYRRDWTKWGAQELAHGGVAVEHDYHGFFVHLLRVMILPPKHFFKYLYKDLNSQIVGQLKYVKV